jgi:flagellin
LLGSAPASTGTNFEVDGTNRGAYVAAADATTGTAAIYDFDATALLDNAGALSTAVAGTSTVEVDFGNYTISVENSDADTLGNLVSAINAKTTDWTFSYDAQTYEIKAVAANPEAHTAGITITEKDANGAAVAGGAFGATGIMTMVSDTAGADPTDATEASGGSHLYLDIQSADSYTMVFTKADATTVNLAFDYDGTSGSRDTVATLIDNALGAGYTVTHDQGQIHIIDEAGANMTLSSFTSSGNGRIVASTDANSGGTQGLSEILDDTVFGTAAVQAAATTVAKPTDVDISFTAIDTYAFTISDGNRTAVVDATAVSAITTTAGVAEMKAAIEYGLAEAGMSSSITVTDNADGSLTLVQSAGREITFGSFKSDQAGSMETVSGSTDTTGVAKYLDDGNASSADSVANVKLTSSTLASTAMNIIDNALDDVSNERAKLGAIMNRLDHTINSMTNVAVNTESSKGRIMDADFAAETVALSKSQILSQAATSMLAQANQSKQTVLALLQG